MTRSPFARLPIVVATFASALAGCAATPLQQPAAAQVVVTQNAPDEDCVFVGEVRGSQGNFWTAEFTSDENLIIGARNRLRDQAYAMGANYVQIELENQSHNTANTSVGGVFSSVIIGNSYRCPMPQKQATLVQPAQ